MFLRFRSPAYELDATDRVVLQVSTSSVNPPSAPSPPPASEQQPQPLALSARPGKAGFNAFFAPAYLEPVLDHAQEALRQGREVLVAVLEDGKQSEANDLGIAVALVLFCACCHCPSSQVALPPIELHACSPALFGRRRAPLAERSSSSRSVLPSLPISLPSHLAPSPLTHLPSRLQQPRRIGFERASSGSWKSSRR